MENLLKTPRLCEDVELTQDDGIYCLYHRFGNTVLILENEVAVDIAKGIDGVNSMSSIIEMMIDKYQVSDVAELENDVIDLLSILQREGFVVFLTYD